MSRLLIIAKESKTDGRLGESLTCYGFACSTASYDEAMEQMARVLPDIVLVEVNGNLTDSGTWELIRRLKEERTMPIMALVPGETLDSLDGQLNVDDFMVSPHDAKELVLRARRLLNRNGNTDSNELIKSDGLIIDLAKCEVTVEGKVIELTFKEYELLKLMASHRGRVYTRDALLNKIWGYDYFGGDRTVDVHVRRLRSKIEDSKHSFIETVRNIGYRFRKDV
jgi:two-component system alkaline phosphatase synthesis response regulator PhoP